MLNKEKHRTLLFQILKDIFENEVGKYIAFKGGTACYFLYGLDRFSTDLDFDLINQAIDIDTELVQILKKYGKVKKGQQIILSYGESDVNISIDINRRVLKSYNYEFVNFYGTTIKVQDKATIFTNKLFALSERQANRDIYDVYFFFKNLFPINEEAIKEKTGKNLKEFLILIKEKLEKIPVHHKILDGLGEVLDEKQKVFVKTKLLKELLGILEMKINLY